MANTSHTSTHSPLLIVIPLITLGLIGGMVGTFLTTKSTPETKRTTTNASATNGIAKKSLVESNLAFSVGPKDARVTVVEFIDFECPYCRASAPAVEQLMKDYESKSVRFMFRHLPLTTIHPHALRAASGGLCANEQGKFLEAYHAFYQESSLDDSTSEKVAREIGLDLQKFADCMSADRYKSIITKDITDALDLKLNGTPTFFINGRKLEGTQTVEILKATIDQFLTVSL